MHQTYCHLRKDSISLLICHCIINCYLLFTCPPILSASTACFYGGGGASVCHRYPLITTGAIYHAVQYEMRCVFCNCSYIHDSSLLSFSSSYVTRVSQDPSKLSALVPATRTRCTLRKHRLQLQPAPLCSKPKLTQ